MSLSETSRYSYKKQSYSVPKLTDHGLVLRHNPAVTARQLAQLMLLSALWGASFMFIRIASPVLGPNVLALLRIGLATATLALLMVALKERWPRGHWREIAMLGVLSVALPFSLYAWAALRLPAGYSALLNCTSVLFGTVASAWLKEDTLSPAKLVGCVCGFAGVALIVRLGPVVPTLDVVLAALACTMAAACYGLCLPLMKRATSRMPPLAIAASIHVLAFAMVMPGGAWGWSQAQFTPLALAATAVLGIVASGLAYWMHLRLIRQLTPVAALSPAFMIPVFGVLWGWLFLGESLGTGIYAGGALVLLATALVTGFRPWLR